MIFSSQTLLRTLSFTNTASEPSGQPREVSLSVTQNGGVPPSCSVMVTVALINDNVPVVDLSGPAVPSVNYSTSVAYTVPPQRVSIASPTARLVDLDSDSAITTVAITLSPGQQGDQLVLHGLCSGGAAPPTTCSLRYVKWETILYVHTHLFFSLASQWACPSAVYVEYLSLSIQMSPFLSQIPLLLSLTLDSYPLQ